jgi:cytochrome c biogenesis protein CcmG/thiol:disulfide interchange protein DsbE
VTTTGAPGERGGRTWSPMRRVAAGLAVVGLVAVGAWVATRPLGNGVTPAAVGSGAASETGIEVGDAAPELTDASGAPLLKDLDGAPVQLADYAGHPVWIVFWATWCTPCQEEAADIVAAYHAHRGAGLTVLAIDVQEPTTSVRQFVAEHGLDYRVALDPTAAIQARYGGWGLPVHFFLDGHGTIRDRYIGQLTRETMEERLRTIVGS